MNGLLTVASTAGHGQRVALRLRVPWAAVLPIVSLAAAYSVALHPKLAIVAAVVGIGAAAVMSGRVSALALLAVAAVYQAPVANVGPFPGLTLSEMLVPTLLAFLLILGRTATHRGWSVVDKVVAVYALVLWLNLLRSKFLLTTIPNGVNRQYYDYFVAIAIYAAVRTLFAQGRGDPRVLLRLFYVLSLIGAVAGLAVVALHLPVNLGDLRYSVYDYSTGATRAGFLEIFGAVGLAVAVTHPIRFRLVALALFTAALVVSGGRGTVVGAAIAVGVYLAFKAQKNVPRIGAVLLAALVAVTMGLWVWPSVRHQPQIERLTSVNAATFGADGRQLIYQDSLNEFERHPLLGTGLGVPSNVIAPYAQASADPSVTGFYRAQLEVGGHATYAALIKNFGLLGLIPFLAALVIALRGLRRMSSQTANAFFILLLIQAVAMTVGGNGGDPFFFVVLAGASACLLKPVGDEH